MTTWIRDDRGNKCSVEYFGSEEAAKTALASLKDCENCTNCSDCYGCSDCSDCSRCSGCSGCSDCSGCYDCSDCSNIAYLYNRRDLQGDPDDARKAAPPEVPVISNIHQAVYAAASKPESLDMSTWHTCDNTHCWAGWVVTLAGDAGRQLEEFFDTPLAAMKILDASSPLRVSPVRFFESNDEALAAMKSLAEQEATPESRP